MKKVKTFIDQIHQLRFKVIASWPSMQPLKVNDVLPMRFQNLEWVYFMRGCVNLTAKQCTDHPHLFRELRWFEERTLDELLSVQFVRITEYTGYWKVGDCVQVTDFEIDAKNKKVINYILERTQHSAPEKCIPVTEKEYKANRNAHYKQNCI